MIRPSIVAIVTVVLAGVVRPTCAQEPSTPWPTEYHEVLAQYAGVWEGEATLWSWADPTEPRMQATGTVDAEIIMGGRFLVEEIRVEMGGQPLHGMAILGYSTAAGEYQGVSFDTNSTEMTRYTGRLTETGDIELRNTFADPSSGQTVSHRTVLRLISADEWLETVYETREGVERLVREVRFRRIR